MRIAKIVLYLEGGLIMNILVAVSYTHLADDPAAQLGRAGAPCQHVPLFGV